MQQNHQEDYPDSQSPSNFSQQKGLQTSDQPFQDEAKVREIQEREQEKESVRPNEMRQEIQNNNDSNTEQQDGSQNQTSNNIDQERNNQENQDDSQLQKSQIIQDHQDTQEQNPSDSNLQQKQETDRLSPNFSQKENLPQHDNTNQLDNYKQQEQNDKENQNPELNEINKKDSHIQHENKSYQDNCNSHTENDKQECNVQKINLQSQDSGKSPLNKQNNILSPKFQLMKSQNSQDECVLSKNLTTIRQASFNDGDKKVLDELQLENGQLSRSYSELSANEYSSKLKVLFKNCFYSNELENLDQWFKELQKLIAEIQACEITVFDLAFFKKVILLAQLDNPKKSLKVVCLFHQLFNEYQIIELMLKLSDYARIVVDVINSYYILLEKFKNTKIEIDLKIGFNTYQTLLDTLGHYEEFKVLIEQQTTLKSLNYSELSSDQKEIFEMIKHYSKFKEIHQKQESIKYIILLLGKCDTVIQQYKIMVYHLSPIFLELSNVNFQNDESKIDYINQVLDIIDRYILPIEFLINFETSRIQGTKTYHLNNLKQIVQYFNKLYTLVGGFLNSVLLMPQEIQLNLRALFIIRRMYYFFYDDLSMRQLMEGPIVVILSNLAMFTKDLVQKKEPTLFLHKLLDDKGTLNSLKEKLESNQYIITLKENKYFGVMAKSYPFDIDIQYNFKSLNFQVNYPVYKKIDAGSFFYYNVLILIYFQNVQVTKPDTIIYWSFKTLNYDIRFGLFKMDTLSSELQIDSYEEEKQSKAIVKLYKADSHKEPVMAYSLVSLPGFYRIVFDNTYSYWREKELLYSIQVLEL